MKVVLAIVVAIVIGWLVYKRRVKLLVPSLIALAVLYFFVWVGVQVPIDFVEMGMDKHRVTTGWIFFLLIYSAIASLLPVWLLLQPRDYINSHQLMVALGLLVVGLFVKLLRPKILLVVFIQKLHTKLMIPMYI